MTFVAALPAGGLAGWTFLKRTMGQQINALAAQPAIQRDEAYFREKIAKVETAEQLVNDPRLLRIALSAFGLQADMANKFFIRKVLEDGTLRTDALANRLTNKQYQKFSAAFGFGNFSTPRTKLSDFADQILVPFKKQQFAIAIGNQSDTLRLALTAESELPEIAKSTMSSTSKWYTVLANAPLRAVFERAFGLPSSFAAIDLDKQVEVLRKRTSSAFGTDDIAQFSDAKKLDTFLRQFLARAEINPTSQSISGQQAALVLLQQIPPPYPRA